MHDGQQPSGLAVKLPHAVSGQPTVIANGAGLSRSVVTEATGCDQLNNNVIKTIPQAVGPLRPSAYADDPTPAPEVARVATGGI